MSPEMTNIPTKLKTLYLILAVVLTVLIGPAFGQPVPDSAGVVQPNSAQEAVVRELGATLKNDNVEAAGQLMTEEAATQFKALLEASDRFQKAHAAFQNALSAKFGTRFSDPVESPVRSSFKEIESISIKQVSGTGDGAQQAKAEIKLKDAERAQTATIGMMNQNGKWRIGLSDPQLAELNQRRVSQINRLIEKTEQLTRDVAGGKYESSMAAQIAFQEMARKSWAKEAAK